MPVATLGPRALQSLLIICMIILPLTIGARQWVFRKRKYTFAAIFADACIWGALVVAEAQFALYYIFVQEEKRLRHRYDNNEKLVTLTLITPFFLKAFFATTLTYTVQLWLLKGAFLGYFYTLQYPFTRLNLSLTRFTSVYVLLSFLALIGLQLGSCWPLSRNWTLVAKDVCVLLQNGTVGSIHTFLNFTSDVLILTVGLLITKSLKLEYRREKVAVYAIAVLGSVSIIICLLRYGQLMIVVVNPNHSTLTTTARLIALGALEILFATVAFSMLSYDLVLGLRPCTPPNATASSRNTRNGGSSSEKPSSTARPTFGEEDTARTSVESSISRFSEYEPGSKADKTDWRWSNEWPGNIRHDILQGRGGVDPIKRPVSVETVVVTPKLASGSAFEHWDRTEKRKRSGGGNERKLL